MSVQSQINRINSTKENISESIRKKGVSVPQGSKLDTLAGFIDSIKSGGGDIAPFKKITYEVRTINGKKLKIQPLSGYTLKGILFFATNPDFSLFENNPSLSEDVVFQGACYKEEKKGGDMFGSYRCIHRTGMPPQFHTGFVKAKSLFFTFEKDEYIGYVDNFASQYVGDYAIICLYE